MCRFDFSTVVDDVAILIDERLTSSVAASTAIIEIAYLRDVESSHVSLTVPENAEDTRLLYCGPDAVHLVRFLLHRVVEIFVHEFGIVDGRLIEYAPYTY